MGTGQRAYRYDLPSGADSVSASPGFTWGRSGKAVSGAYLINDTVPSNLTGRIVPLYDGLIDTVFVASENADTFVIAIEKRVGAVFTELCTVTVTAARTKIEYLTNINVAYGDELACKIKSGSCKNPVVGIIIKGDSV